MRITIHQCRYRKSRVKLLLASSEKEKYANSNLDTA